MDDFDLGDFLDAFRGEDLDRWAGWYAPHAEWVEYRHQDPPRDPHVMRGREEIGAHLAAVCAGPVEITVDHVVRGETSAAFMVTVTLPAGRRIIENVIIEIAGGQVSRQIDVEAGDAQRARHTVTGNDRVHHGVGTPGKRRSEHDVPDTGSGLPPS